MNHDSPVYDIYMYHGNKPVSFHNVKVKVSVKYDNIETAETFTYNFDEKFNLKNSDNTLHRDHLDRIKLVNFNSETK